MRLQRIYSSKLYITSTRKDKIKAAMQDPVNLELVQQLSEYLDDNSKVELKQVLVQEVEKHSGAESASAEVAPSGNSDSGASAPKSSHSGSHSSFTGDIMKDFGTDELADVEIPEDAPGGESAPESAPVSEETPVEESTKIEGTPITGSTAIIWTTLDDVISDIDSIKGTLNVREDTCGVTRIQVSDHELWIYYNDDSNLNDKMVEVIEVFNAAGYTYLKFNRLARSNNAMVFDISLSNTEDVKPIKEIEEETK